MGAVYKNYKTADYKNTIPGYSVKAWLLPVDWLQTEADVVGNAAAGNRKTIDETHIVMAGKGAIAVFAAPKTIDAPGELSGPQLGKSLLWKPKIYIPGDGPVLLDMIEGLVNKGVLLFIEDAANCKNGVSQYVQFGCGCDPATVEAGAFNSGVVGGDQLKGYELGFESFCKFFYNGVLTELDPEVEIIE
ncbi:MAG TPA: hypothetical protein VFS22_10180 [Flavisolibacter sp.]|nr:hypothetical protein [Flavisolibacter sp.]